MRCPKCGTGLQDGTGGKYCPFCGWSEESPMSWIEEEKEIADELRIREKWIEFNKIRSMRGIKFEVNRILKEAHKQKDKFPGAINWGNLKCVGTRYCMDEIGKETYLVLIEEASPDNSDLQEFVKEQLALIFNLSKDTFECRTEW